MDISPDLDSMSAQDLYALAEQKEREEALAKKEEHKERLKELRQKRRQLIREYEKNLANVEAEIEQLSFRKSKRSKQSVNDSTTVTQTIIQIISENGRALSTQEIRDLAQEAGLETHNISQTLSYLKRQGRLDSPSRGIYSLPQTKDLPDYGEDTEELDPVADLSEEEGEEKGDDIAEVVESAPKAKKPRKTPAAEKKAPAKRSTRKKKAGT